MVDEYTEKSHIGEEISVTPEFVTVSWHVPTEEYYKREIAPVTERCLTDGLRAELDWFLSLISYQVTQAYRNAGGRDEFEFSPVIGAIEPFPKEIPDGVFAAMTPEVRAEHPMVAELIGAWEESTPQMHEAYDAIIDAEQAYHVLDMRTWDILHGDKSLDMESMAQKSAERDAAKEAAEDARRRHADIMKAFMADVSAIASKHMEEARRYAWGELGLDQWVTEHMLGNAE